MSTPSEDAVELPDIYAPAAQLLTMLSIGNQALLSRPEDPLPRALAGLIDYDTDTLKRVMAVQDSAAMFDLLDTDPTALLNHLLLGRLVYHSPLGPSLATVFAPDGSADDDTLGQRRAEAQEYVAQTLEWYEPALENGFLVERYPEDQQDEVREARAALRAAVETAFAEWQHSLGALLLPAPVPAVLLAGAGWSLQPVRLQLDSLAMAATVTKLLPAMTDHPFAEAVARLPDFHPQRLEELSDYLTQATADERLYFNRARGLLLYVAAHVVLLMFMHDVLAEGGLDDLLLRSNKRQQEFGDELPALVGKLREVTAIILGGYIEEVRANEGETADFLALEARLRPVLALASS